MHHPIRSISRRTAIVGALGLAVAVTAAPVQAATAPSASAAAISLKGVNLRVGGQTDGLRSLLVASGALKGKAYKLTWSTFTSGPPILEALQANRIDIGGVGNTPPIFAAATRPNFRLVAGIPQSGANSGDFVLVKKGSPATKIADLKGKKIAYTRGSSGHGFILQALKKAGLTTKDVTLVDLTPGDSLAAFNSGAVDGWATWEPFASIAGEAGRVLPAGSGYAAAGLNFFAASNSALADVKKRTAIRDYLVRLQRAIAWGTKNKLKWAQAFNAESGLPVDLALKSIKSANRSVTPVTSKLIAQEQKLANVLAETGIVKKISIKSITSNQLAK